MWQCGVLCLAANLLLLVYKPWVLSSRLRGTLSEFLIKMAKFVSFNRIRFQCGEIRTEQSPLTPKDTSFVLTTMSKKLTVKYVISHMLLFSSLQFPRVEKGGCSTFTNLSLLFYTIATTMKTAAFSSLVLDRWCRWHRKATR